MTRLFVALPVPPALRDALALTRGGLEGARWVDPGDYHLTLRFLGEVAPPDARALRDALGAVAAYPFALEPLGFGVFGGGGPGSLHLALRASDPLRRLKASVDEAARAAGLGPPDKRRYSPHVTLARFGYRGGKGVAGWLAGRAVPDAPFPADEIALYAARPGGGGPYHAVETWPLGHGWTDEDDEDDWA